MIGLMHCLSTPKLWMRCDVIHDFINMCTIVQGPNIILLTMVYSEVVVAQVVEQWHSDWAGRVRIPGWILAFFSSE